MSGVVDQSGSHAPPPPTDGGYTISERGPLYHDMAPKKKLLLQIFFSIVVIMVLVALIYCFVVSKSHYLYLLGVNQFITLLNGAILMKWYLSGTLPSNWLWYLVLVGVFLLFQSIVTDVMVGEYPYVKAPPPTTLPPTYPTHNPNITTTNGNLTRPPPNITTNATKPTTHALFAITQLA